MIKSKKLKKAIFMAAALIAVFFVWKIFAGGSKKEKVILDTQKVEYKKMVNSVTATGTLEPVVKVEVGTQVSGIIDKIYVDYNSEVKKGQLIAEMDKVTLQSELQGTQAEVASNKTQYEYQLKNYNRNRLLHEKGLLSDSEYETALYQYEVAKNNYDKSLATLDKVKRNLGYATINSPIDGVVISRAVEEGQTVAAGFSTPTLFTIANDLTQMQVIADVDEADIGEVKEGQSVEFTVDAYPNDTFHGEVTQVRLEATVTNNVVTYEVVISAPNPDYKLKPGLTANVTITTMQKNNVLAAPSKAFRFNPNIELLNSINISVTPADEQVIVGKHLWIKQGNSLKAVAVKVGVNSGNFTEILSGDIKSGDEVAVGMDTFDPLVAANASKEQSPFMPQPPGKKR